jgi:hypothetical protein
MQIFIKKYEKKNKSSNNSVKLFRLCFSYHLFDLAVNPQDEPDNSNAFECFFVNGMKQKQTSNDL